ncbi:MAG: YbhB/YbcL family Raf kinase inhibitor-like protein [Minisyncoccia bacterium]
MILTSPSFQNNAPIPRKFTCDGGGINPEFQIQNVPAEAKSLALILHDPDAPREGRAGRASPIAGGFFHWVLWNISPQTTLIKEESAPPGAAEGLNGAGKPGYAPPCPPPGHGVHHYRFKLYALDVALDLPTDTMATDLAAAIAGHILSETELVGTYERN